jgi:hypothetical protein
MWIRDFDDDTDFMSGLLGGIVDTYDASWQVGLLSVT